MLAAMGTSQDQVFVSPLDTRYLRASSDVAYHLSEYALSRNRIIVEVEWLRYLVKEGITPVSSLDATSDGTFIVSL